MDANFVSGANTLIEISKSVWFWVSAIPTPIAPFNGAALVPAYSHGG